MIVYDAARRPVTLGGEVARGGEGIVYAAAGRPGVLAKIYTPRPREGHEEKLTWMLAHPPQDPAGNGASGVRASGGHASIAWPTDLLFDAQRHFLGYLMPQVTGGAPALAVFNPRTRAATWPNFDRRYLHRSARNLAAALAALHESNYIVGDLNESNVLVTSSALVTLIDTDSFQVQEPRNGRIIVYPCPVGKAEYTPPELQGRALNEVYRQPQHDAFALAVLIFQLLMGGSHPFRARWLAAGDALPLEERIHRGYFPYVQQGAGGAAAPVAPPPGVLPLDSLHPEVAALMRRCFVEGHEQPGRRPAAREWERALTQAELALVRCAAGHIYDQHLSACPVCGDRRAQRLSTPTPTGQQPAAGAVNGRRAYRGGDPLNGGSHPWGQGAGAQPPGRVMGIGGISGGAAGGATGAAGAGAVGAGSAYTPPAWVGRLEQIINRYIGAWAAPRTAAPRTAAPRTTSPRPTSPQATATRPSPQQTVVQPTRGRRIGRTLLQLMMAALGAQMGLAGRTAPAQTVAGAPLYLVCGRCAAVSRPDEIFCQTCGESLTAYRACRRCGRRIPQNSRYCPHCDAKLS
jgi:RNA polymerase subunit RPABC4/transcription elongation factor Spt4